jgi:hypothetical protein
VESTWLSFAHGVETPVYVYKTRLRGLKTEPTQVGFVNIDRGFIPVSGFATIG